MQNIDKLAIGAAILFIICGLAYPYVMDPAPDLSELNELTQAAQEKANEQNLGALEESSILEEVEGYHQIDEMTDLSGWNFYRRPARVKIWQEDIIEPPIHEAGQVTLVKARRDDELQRPVLDVSVELGRIERAGLTGAEIQIQVEGGEWETKVQVKSGGKVTITDLALGKNYFARLVTRVEPENPEGVNGGFSREQISDQSETAVWLPVDENWTAKSFVKANPVQGQTADKVTIQREYWDYEAGKAKRKQEFQVPFESVSGWEKRKGLCGTEFRLYKVVWGGKVPYCEIRDPAQGRASTIRLEKGAKPLSMDPGEWIAPIPETKEGDGDDGEMTDEPDDSPASSGDDDGDGGSFFGDD